TRSTSVEAAVRAMKHGAADYITKPLDYQRLRKAVVSALEVHQLSRRRVEQEQAGPAAARDRFHGLLGRSGAMSQLFQHIENVAPTDVSALILGETGTGKELVARAIHNASNRREGPFVAVNAAAIPHELIESALFGHEKGAFTGAREAHAGYCEQADGGTLFLDEIAEMDYAVQAKLLRFLQDHQVQRVGASRGRPVDVRVLAATNVDPVEEIRQRRLREDLYYRLRVVSLRLPPLRERGEDVLLLARHFLRRASERHQRGFRDFDAAALRQLEAYPWPGNVREMENLIEEAVVLHRGEVLTAAMLPRELVEGGATGVAGLASTKDLEPRWSPRDERRREELRQALDEAGGDPESAGEILGVSRATVYRWMKKYSIPRP
ncbi:MAG: sigma-54 dependent transcriptional regulator, partial [Acidobacteriota bacterium]|nr:sigma-54 dependent transcriptional regulator [Acidobacteriota bacterium]